MTSAAATPAPPATRHLPYGEQQGSFHGVVACSNRDDGYFSGENNYVNSLIYTGYRYQCVEYARRFLLLTTGCVFDNCGRASEIYAMTHITDVQTGKKYDFHHHKNDGTATQKPQPGDIIIYPYHPELTPWGHVGVISYVDDTRVGIVEQNEHFGPFISPDQSYLDGERCVARFADLKYDTEKQTWCIEEASAIPASTGWLSYPDAPRREQIHAPLNPLPEAIRDRSTAFDHLDHPFISHYHLHTALNIPCGRVRHAFGMRTGSAETLVGATSATARVLRFTMQFFFDRSQLGQTFRSLPTNPLNAVLPAESEATAQVTQDLNTLFAPFMTEEAIGPEEMEEGSATPVPLLQALATYFDIPLEWVAAMQREFGNHEMHLASVLSFYANEATEEEDVRTFSLVHENVASHMTPTDAHSPSSIGPGTPQGKGPEVLTTPGAVEHIPLRNPHDEAWSLAKVNFGNARLLTEMAQLTTVKDELAQAISVATPAMHSFMSTQFRMDFAGYLKMVETVRGSRTAFTIVLSDDQPMDGLLRELVTLMQSLCERVKYPVRVVHESDLAFKNGKLLFTASEASPAPSSPMSSNTTPLGDYEVNLVYVFCEWPRLLQGREGVHAALYHAVIDPASDVVFAKPLWSYLCSGLVNVNDVAELGGSTPADAAKRSRSVRFYDIVRRLYHWAAPKQSYESWDQEVSEFKDSCRRIHLDSARVPLNSPAMLRGESAMLNLATSCFMGHVGALNHADEENSGDYDGEPAALCFMFPAD